MNARQILAELKSLGSPGIKKVLLNHGIREPFFGVKISELKKIQKRIRVSYPLSLELYATGNYDAMYLAGLIADDARMTRADLQSWVDAAYCGPLAGATVAWVTAGSPHGWEMALKWIDSSKPLVACAGWATLSSLVSITEDDALDLPALKQLLQRVEKTIHQAPDRVRHQMNGFLIALGVAVAPMTTSCVDAGKRIGVLTADLGPTACQVPFAPDSISKARQKGVIGKKRKSAKC